MANVIANDIDAATGRLVRVDDDTYLTVRNATEAGGAGGANSANIIVGQNLSDTYYYVDRSALTFDTSALPDTSIIVGAILSLDVIAKFTSGGDFILNLVNGTFSGQTLLVGWFNDFTGWAASGSYSVTPLANTINTADMANGGTLFLTLNDTGLGVINKAGNTTLMLLSSKDISATAPTGQEQVMFDDDTPYLRVFYTEQSGVVSSMVFGKGIKII